MTWVKNYEQKLEMLKAGQYRFKAPPVCTAYWDDDSWVKFIDSYNGWIDPIQAQNDRDFQYKPVAKKEVNCNIK